MKHAVIVSCGVLLFLMTAAPAGAMPIVVNLGDYDSAEAAAHDEANVNWRDGDYRDDTICTESFAAVELQHYLRAIHGATSGFAIIDDNAPAPAGDTVLIGGPDSNAMVALHAQLLGVEGAALDTLGPEGYIIKTVSRGKGRFTWIAGGGRVGTLYGVYDLLHRLGVRWYAPGAGNEEVPRLRRISLPDLQVRETPKFLTRGFHAWEDRGTPDFIRWMARNRINYWCVQQTETDLLHKLGIMLVGGGHVLTSFYLAPHDEYPYNHAALDSDDTKPADPYEASTESQGDANGDGKLTYFEAHPEWYALRKGKRSDRINHDFGDNFCTSNPDAMAEWTKNAVDDLVDGRYKDADIINAWTLDGGGWCECEHCKALGTQTDRNLLFVHRYDRAIKQAQAEGRINRPVRLLFLAYADVLEPPTRPLPPTFDYSTCIATYFPIVRCYVHNLDDPGCSSNAKYLKHLDGWAIDPDRHYKGQLCIGEYYNVSGYKCLPICYMHTMAHDIPMYYERTGARHFHYMHCTVDNWGNKALTNWQMARQLWDPKTDCNALWDDYFRGRYGEAAHDMRAFYEHLEPMLSNCSELKYGLAGRLDKGADNLFPKPHLKYETTAHDTDDGPDLDEILVHAAACRDIIDAVRKRSLPERIAQRVAEDERLFTYGERTVQFYDALCRCYFDVRKGDLDAARKTYAEAKELADLLAADTESTKWASSHANAANALEASRAAGALAILSGQLGPLEPAEVKVFGSNEPLVLTGRDFQGGGALRFGYQLYIFPGRTKVSDAGNYVYGGGTKPYNAMKAWFRVDELPKDSVQLRMVGLRCPDPPGGEVLGQVTVNEHVAFEGQVPFSETALSEHTVAVSASAFKAGVNNIEIRNTEPEGQVGGRPWFGIDRVELTR